jgi:hypothetical protein
VFDFCFILLSSGNKAVTLEDKVSLLFDEVLDTGTVL